VTSSSTATVIVDRATTANFAQVEFRTADAQVFAIGVRPDGKLQVYVTGGDTSPIVIHPTTGDIMQGYTTFVYSADFNNQEIWAVGDPTQVESAANKRYVDARTPKITVSNTVPANPGVGDVWIDTS
jgi:hypothetical protein